MLSLPLVKVGRPQFTMWFVAREHGKRADDDRVGHGHHRAFLPTTGGKPMIEGRQIRVLRPHGDMGYDATSEKTCRRGAS